MEDLWPVIGFVIYVLLQLLGVFGGSKDGEGSTSPDQSTDNKPQRSIFREIGKQFDDLEKRMQSLEPSSKTRDGKKPATPNSTQSIDDYKSPGQEYTSLADEIELTQYEPISSEVLNSPYSNLEEGVIDDVHKAKFAHHGGKVPEAATVKQREKINLFEEIPPEKAFVYSLIFDRKYFKI